MDYSFEIQQKLKANHQLQEIYAEIGSVPRDTLIAARHGFIDHLMGPQSLWEVFSSKERYRPHEKRVLTDMYDPFYVIQGTSRVVGTSWLSGLVVGGVQGFYEGLSKRQTRSWRTAYQSLLSFSRNKAPLRANQFAAVAFVCCFWEDIFRYMVLSNASHLQYGTHGWILGRFGSNKEEEKQAWQTDGRMCAVPGATVGVVTLRLLKGGAGAKAGVLMSNAILAAIGGFIYSYACLPLLLLVCLPQTLACGFASHNTSPGLTRRGDVLCPDQVGGEVSLICQSLLPCPLSATHPSRRG